MNDTIDDPTLVAAVLAWLARVPLAVGIAAANQLRLQLLAREGFQLAAPLDMLKLRLDMLTDFLLQNEEARITFETAWELRVAALIEHGESQVYRKKLEIGREGQQLSLADAMRTVGG